jgi:hypothetical protein
MGHGWRGRGEGEGNNLKESDRVEMWNLRAMNLDIWMDV